MRTAVLGDSAVHVVVPEGIDDAARPSGGNVYDRRVCDGLAEMGWAVQQHAVPGSWPQPDAGARAALARVVRGLPDDSVVLVDGLLASTSPEVLVPASERLRLVVLVHMPADDHAAAEESVLTCAASVVTTSAWTRHTLVRRYPLRPGRVHVAAPGVDVAEVAPGTTSGGQLLCVAAVVHGKGHDVLVSALAAVADRDWRCVCVGPLDREPSFVERVSLQAAERGIGDRVRLTGPRTGTGLDAEYAAADLLVLASRAETYGMVVTEALAHGVPVVATDVGGVSEALGRAPDGSVPGLLVPPGDDDRLREALRSWLADSGLRQRLRQAARRRRSTLAGWPETAARVSHALCEVSR